MRQGQFGHSGYTATEANNIERLSNLKRAIEQLENRLAQSQAQTLRFPTPTHPPHYDGVTPSASQDTLSDMSSLQQRLSALASQVANPGVSTPIGKPEETTARQPQDDEIANAAAEIVKRQQALSCSSALAVNDELLASIQEQSDKAVDTLSKQLSSLKKELTSLKRQVSTPVTVESKVAEEEVDRIAKAINNLQKTSKSQDELALQKLGKDINALRTGVKADVEGVKNDIKRTVRRELGASNGNQTTDITSKLQKELTERMAALTQDVSAASAEQASAMMPRVDHITSQVDALKTSVDSLPSTLSIDGLENSLEAIAQKIETLMQDQTSATAAAKNALSSKDLSAIEKRLDEVSRSLVAVSSLTEKVSTPDMSGVDRVEARMSDLARAIDEIRAKDTGVETINELAVRIEGLTERLGSFEKYAETGDLGGASQLFAAPDIGVLEEQIRQLTDRIDSTLSTGPAVAAADTGNLEAQIAQLTARFEEASAMNSTAAQMSNLEAQVGQIIRKMNKAQPLGEGVSVDLSVMEERLAEIENQIVNGQNVSLEAAQQAAQQAVSMMGDQSAPGQIISALSEDLKTLQAVAENGSQQSIQTTEQVQQTLSQVVDRLNAIEDAITEAASAQAHLLTTQPQAAAASPDLAAVPHSAAVPDMPHAPQDQMEAIQQAAMNAGLVQPHRLEEDVPLQVDAPSIDPTAAMEAQTPVHTAHEVNDLNLGQSASNAQSAIEQNVGMGASSPADTSRSSEELRPDAVAAARRALQATSAEINAVKEEAANAADSKTKKVKRSLSMPSFGASKLRKPLIMGAAALLLAVVAFKGFDMLKGGGGGDVPVAKVETQAITPDDAVTEEDETRANQDSDVVASDTETRVVDEVENAQVSAPTPVIETPDVASDQTDATQGPNDALAALTNKVTEAADETQATISDAAPAAADAAKEAMEAVIPTPQLTETPAPVDVTKVEPVPETSTPANTASVEVPSEAGSKALVSAAESGDEKALFQVGMRYSEGNGVKRDLTQAAKWFEMSAERGFAPAQYSIGSLYEKGIGVERDVKKASDWYEKAASQGNARAMHNLAVIYAMGNPPAVQPQMEKAVTWFQKAADYGIKDSQFNLGILYGQGMGVPQNLTDSFKWFALAAKTGDADAAAKRDEVANAMEPTELAGARKAVNDWAPKKLIEESNRVAIPKEWQGNGRAKTASAKTQDARGQLKQAQTLLNKRGFDVGDPDGLMGPRTKRAIMEFQRSAGIPVTGRVDSELLKALDLQT